MSPPPNYNCGSSNAAISGTTAVVGPVQHRFELCALHWGQLENGASRFIFQSGKIGVTMKVGQL